jgi:hypothetical protein
LKEGDVVGSRNILEAYCWRHIWKIVDVEPLRREELRHDRTESVSLRADRGRREDQLYAGVGDHSAKPGSNTIAPRAGGWIGGHSDGASAKGAEQRGDEVESGRKQQKDARSWFDAIPECCGDRSAAPVEAEPRQVTRFLLTRFKERVGAIVGLFRTAQGEQIRE